MLTLKIEAHSVDVDPNCTVYCVEISDDKWRTKFRFGTAETRDAFLQGVRAIASMAGIEIKMS